MGRGCNRNSSKMLRAKARAKKKARLKRQMESAKNNKKSK